MFLYTWLETKSFQVLFFTTYSSEAMEEFRDMDLGESS